jgi:hypothetical protein
MSFHLCVALDNRAVEFTACGFKHGVMWAKSRVIDYSVGTVVEINGRWKRPKVCVVNSNKIFNIRSLVSCCPNLANAEFLKLII